MPAPWQDVLDALMRERRAALVGYAFAFAGDLATAEDLVHDAVVRTFAKPRDLRSVPAAEAYVRRAIATTFFNRHRRLVRLRDRAHLLVEDAEHVDPAEGVLRRERVHAALQQLSPRERACAVLRFYEDLTVAQIADVLGVRAGSVKRYLSDGAAKLRAHLGEDALDDPPSRTAASVGRTP